MKRWGLAGLAARSGVLKLLGFGALGEMALHVDDAPERTLDEVLTGRPELGPPAEAAWTYFAPCGPRWLMPRVGEATIEVLGALHGRGASLANTCCGLLSFNYGSLAEARASAKAVIGQAESAGVPSAAPVVGDCSSCVSFLKSYPQLFLEEPAWKARAEAFAARVKDAVEMLPAGSVPEDARVKDLVVHDACRLRNGQNCADAPRPALKAVAGGTLKALAKPEHCCGGAGAFAFVHPELSEDLLKAKVADIADSQARVVAAASTSCLVQLERGLRKYYSACRVAHPTELVAEALRRRKSDGAPENNG